MKNIVYVLLVMLLITAYACNKIDNYSPPGSELDGALTYKGDSIYLEYGRVPYQLYQYGFGKVGPIESSFTQSGVMSQVLFNGNYEFIIPNGQGPFLWPQTSGGAPDSVDISLNGSQNLNIEVTPYYMIRNANITGGGGGVSASCSVEQVITDANAKDIESVTLYINKTQFVSGTNNIASASIAGADILDPNNITLTVAVSGQTQKYVFARVGLKISGVEDLIFSPLFQVNY